MAKGAAMRGIVAAGLALALLGPGPAGPEGTVVILSTTTSTQDSGLLEVLVPIFERKSGYTVKTISVGTGQALALAARGEADVTLAHAPELEKRYVAGGRLLNRRPVMFNDFVVVGPSRDPAGVRSAGGAAEAFRRIAAGGSRFVSRGDNSGTHALERRIWKEAGVAPRGGWYIESGQGMGATLGIANDRDAYALTDRATYLVFRRRVSLPVLLEGDRRLVNLYSVMEVNPANGPRVNAAGGTAFADFLVSAEAQAVIGRFGVERLGQPLFVPVAGQREEEIGG
jgi:tungstate transport system substrate-binding protein